MNEVGQWILGGIFLVVGCGVFVIFLRIAWKALGELDGRS